MTADDKDQALDQLLGFQQAAETAASIEDLAALACRAAERLTGAAVARLCLGGVLLPLPCEPFDACCACPYLGDGGEAFGDRAQVAVGGCCVGGAGGWRSVPVCTGKRLFGFLLLQTGTGGAVVASVAGITAAELEKRELIRALATARRELRGLRDDLARGGPIQGGGESSVRLLKRAVEQSPSSIAITTADGRFEYVNPGFVRTTGYRPEEVIGREPSMLKSGLTPAEDYRELWRVISSGAIWHGEFHNRRKDGSLYWVAASISPVRDEGGVITHFVAVEEDITEIMALQQRVSRSEERYRSASEASLDGLFILEAVRDGAGSVTDFRFAEVNSAGSAMLGRSRETIIGHLLAEVLPHAHAKGFFEKYRRVFLHREVLDEQFEVEEPLALPMWIHHTVVPLADGIAVTSRNVTELKRYEAALMAARSAAEDANAAKSIFLATMSHELRTPLNAILGFSELIRDEAFGPVGMPRYAEYAGDIHASGQHLLDLITSILDISKIEAGKLDLDLRRLDLRPTLEQCLHLFHTRAEVQELTLIRDFAPELPEIRADERAVRQMMLNLLSNAVKFTPPRGSVTLRVAADGPDWVDITVADTGIGIPEDQLDRVMRPFEQLDNSYTRGAGGTGLGLALVKALADLHGGAVSLTSAVQRGTTVSVRLPVAGPDATQRRSRPPALGHSGL
ncbi:MAG: ATP-binding protein [Rhodospirillaceae bacterium]